jgi:hypothetical protein
MKAPAPGSPTRLEEAHVAAYGALHSGAFLCRTGTGRLLLFRDCWSSDYDGYRFGFCEVSLLQAEELLQTARSGSFRERVLCGDFKLKSIGDAPAWVANLFRREVLPELGLVALEYHTHLVRVELAG